MEWRLILDVVDILVVAVLLYYALLWLRGTRAVNLIRGIILLIVIYFVARFLGLYTINWLFEMFATAIIILLIIVFQPELRRTLDRLGRGRLLARVGFTAAPGSWFIRNLVRAMEQLSEDKVGAIIVIEKNTGLAEYVESGTRLDAALSSELLVSIFQHRSLLHDGAAIIQGDRLLAASCLLPLSESRLLDKRLGTRHRAAVGLSELTDAVSLVVSEQTGTISIAENGYLTRFITREMLEEKLFSLYREQYPKFEFHFPWSKKRKKK